MSVKLIHVTPDSEKLIVYMARVSSPNQDNPESEKLIKYLLDHKHFSPFEMVNMAVEITTTKAISIQILRHRSFSFQEFSQRYSKVTFYTPQEARLQDTKNRQNSIKTDSKELKEWFKEAQDEVSALAFKKYDEALAKGIAKESARFLLPMNTSTKLYMNGNLRSWIHFVELRTDKSTQLEHRVIAEKIKRIMIKEFPILAKALNWA